MSYQRCTTPGPLIEVVKTWSVSRRSYLCPDRTPCDNHENGHDVPIQFISSTLALNPHGEMDRRINGCTWPMQFSRASEDASRTPALLSNPRMRWSNEARYFFFSSCLSFLSFISSFVHSFLFFYSLHRARLCPSSGHSRYSKTSSQSRNILSTSGNFTDVQDVTYRREQSQDTWPRLLK